MLQILQLREIRNFDKEDLEFVALFNKYCNREFQV